MVKDPKNNKLYVTASDSFAITRYVDKRGSAVPLPAGGAPIVFWPDGRWCFPVNEFLASRIRLGLSLRNRGGTLHTYATQLSHLVRFCYLNNTDFINLTDSQFTLFANGLSARSPHSVGGAPLRSARSARSICNLCLEFLHFVGVMYGQAGFVDAQGSIRAERATAAIKFGARTRKVHVWRHHALPLPDVERKRLPVGSDAISRLRGAAVRANSSSFVKKRRLVLLTLLQVTGARRTEVVNLTVDSVLASLALDSPRLQLISLKGRGQRKDRMREVPVSRHDMEMVRDYIEFYRNPLVAEKLGDPDGDGSLLVSEVTGTRLHANTITQEVWELRKLAELEAAACAHMFRHRFVTKLLIALIEEHDIANHDEFRKRLMGHEELKQKVCEWTGHADQNSLNRYIHLAFEEMTNTAKVIDVSLLKFKLDSFKTQLADRQLMSSDPEVTALLEAFRAELDEFVGVSRRSTGADARVEAEPTHGSGKSRAHSKARPIGTRK